MDTTPGASEDPSWTPRQTQVLDLLARGRTNWQIAEALGISLEGAKWHVRGVVAKLGVDGREAAAEYWRRRSSTRSRLRRSLAVLGSPRAWWLGATAATAALVAGAWLAFHVLPGDHGGELTAVAAPTATSETSTPGPAVPEFVSLPLPPGIHVTWASVGVGGPFNPLVTLPLDSRRPDDAATLARIEAWLDAARWVGPVEGLPDAAGIGISIQLGLSDGRRVEAVQAWNCTRTATMTSCVAVDGGVDLLLRDAHGIHSTTIRFEAPGLEDWLREGWQSDVRMGSIDEQTRLLRDLAGP